MKGYIRLALVAAILVNSLISEGFAQCTGQNVTYGTFDGAGYSGYNRATTGQAAPSTTDIPNNGLCWSDASSTSLSTPSGCEGGYTFATSDDGYEDWATANSVNTHSGNMMLINMDGSTGDYVALTNTYTGCSTSNTYALSVDFAMINRWPVGAGTRAVSLEYFSGGSWVNCGSSPVDMSNLCNVCGAGSTNNNPGWQTLSCAVPSTSTIQIRVVIHKGFSGGDNAKHDWALDNFSLIGTAPTPVEFISFTGKPSGNGVLLTWTTATELNSSHFEVERSSDGITWEVVGIVDSKNSAEGTAYSFFDSQVSNSTLYYRIKEVDLDNAVMYTEIISVNGSQGYSFMDVLPSLTEQGSQVQITSSSDMVAVSVYDPLGKIVLSTNIDDNIQNLNCGSLVAGVYIIKGLFEGGNTLTKKLVIR